MKKLLFLIVFLVPFCSSFAEEMGGARIKAVTIGENQDSFKMRVFDLVCQDCNSFTWIIVKSEEVGGITNLDRLYAMALTSIANGNNIWLKYRKSGSDAILETMVIDPK